MLILALSYRRVTMPSPPVTILAQETPSVEVPAPSSVQERGRNHRDRALFDGIDDAVFVHDADGRILDANPAACRRLGYTREEFLRLNTRDLDEPAFAAGFAERTRRQRTVGRLTCEGRHLTKDGRIIPVDINTSVIEFDGKPAVLAVCRDISDRKMAERRQAAQHAVTRVLADAPTFDDAAGRILKELGEGLGWDVGAVWRIDKRANVLRCVAVWHVPSVSVPRFEALTRQSPFPPGVGLPGRAWATDAPAWITDVVDDPNFPRADVASQEGLHGGFAFPIRSGGETVGVVEFFLRARDKPDDDLLSMLAALGSQIGQFLDRARVAEALRESEAFYHSLVESLPQNILRKDLEGRFTFANQRACAILGKSLAEVAGKTDFDLFPPALAEKYRADDRNVLQSGKVLQDIEEHRTPAGEKLYVQIVKSPIYDSQGEKIGTQVLFWDVTERKTWEEALSKSERRYRQLTEASQDAIIVADQDGRITLFNPAAERIFGYSAAEVVGQSLAMLVPPDFQERHQAGIRRYIETRESRLIGRLVELRGRRKDGVQFPLELSLSAIDVGDELQFLGAIRDTTERERMRSALVQSEKLASIGLLSAGVAHEINNPLAYVGNNLAVLDRDVKGLMGLLNVYEAGRERLAQVDPEAARRAKDLAEELDLPYVRDNLGRVLTRTREGVQRVARIVQNLRGLARTDRPQMEDALLTDLVETSFELVRGRLQRRGIRVETDFQIRHLRCVPAQISQVILNLLVNALQAIESKAGEQGGVIRIASGLSPLSPDGKGAGARDVVIEIADNGCGIQPNDLARLFDPFFTTKPVGEGTGLGLSITHGIITGHGGRIEVESTPGEGSRFRIYLPQDPQRGPA
jgi:PAS domain S-box-containing protein